MTIEEKKWLRFRLTALMSLFLVLFIALMTRAYQIQVLNGQSLKARADRQHTATLRVESERGIIFDRNGQKLAVSVMSDSVCADPSKIEDIKGTAAKLSAILNIDGKTLVKKMSGAKNFCWLARRITPEQTALVEKLDMEGIFIIKEPKRFYPNGELAGHLIGFVGMDSSGMEGLEFRFEEHLKGEPEQLRWARDAKGNRLFPRVDAATAKQKGGANLILTIDNRIQYLVESQLKAAVQSKDAKGGMAVVMDPKTGEILALANEKGFDPNNFSKIGAAGGKNRVITDCFDPGSTFKPFLAAAALEEGMHKETDKIFCENGNYAVADRVIREAQRKQHGYLSFADIIKYSSNIGCVKISERLGKEKFHDYIMRFGFGQKTGIDLPGETAGLLRPVRNWTRVDTSTIAFGQGVSVTAIQLISALSAIANQGVLMKPYIVRGLVDKQGQIIKKYDPTPVRQVVSPQTARRMATLMSRVVSDQDGTGKNARIENVNIAGKTGTAQKFDFARRVYSSERVRTSFMGFFPVEDPQVAILVVLDEPQRDKWGGVASAPVFKNIAEQILTCFKTHIRENPVYDEDNINRDGKIRQVAAVPAMATRTNEQHRFDENMMPDFRGLTIRQALRRAKELGVELQIAGNGWAVSQAPAPGVAIGEPRYCRVFFSTGQ
ncbi:MAG: penicillin-binding protein [Syntrophus sp. (in: bacteria)]|nr:penicillin-binding protein [Syntrophus sp. (in: bacteria)]